MPVLQLISNSWNPKVTESYLKAEQFEIKALLFMNHHLILHKVIH